MGPAGQRLEFYVPSYVPDQYDFIYSHGFLRARMVQNHLTTGESFRCILLVEFGEIFMKIVIQRVSRARVLVEDMVVGDIGRGFLLLVGFEKGDEQRMLQPAIRRITTLRIFEDDQGKMNRGLDEIGGEILAVSQFTLAASIRKGRRPGFDHVMPSEEARPLFEAFVRGLRKEGVVTKTGVFGADMEVELTNSGPVTLIWETPL